MDILDHYFTAVQKAVYATSNGCNATEELAGLKSLEAQLRNAFDNLVLRPDPIAAAAAKQQQADARKQGEQFIVSWRAGGETEYITGRAALAKRLKLSLNTIQLYLSRGKGTFNLVRFRPDTREKDQLVIIRATPEEIAKRKPGRPPKYIDRERLGAEFDLPQPEQYQRKTPKPTSNRKP